MQPWTFPTDQPARRTYFTPEVFSHPAKLHLGLLQKLIDLYTKPGDTLLDPMAGTGSLMLAATQQRNVILRELQSEYVALMRCSEEIIRRRAGLLLGKIDLDDGDARALNVPNFDHAIFSPPYAIEVTNGMSNARRALVGSKLGRRWQRFIQNPTHAGFAAGFRYAGGQSNSGNKTGRNYWEDMDMIYKSVATALPSGGLLILIVKNHYRRHKLIDITGQTIEHCKAIGLTVVERHGRQVHPLSLWQRRRKEQGLPVVEVEDVLVFTKL